MMRDVPKLMEFPCGSRGAELRREEFFPGLWVNAAAFDRLDVFPKVYWKDRLAQRPVFAAGALLQGSLAEVTKSLDDGAYGVGVRAFGGRAFRGAAVRSHPWQEWADETFFVPLVEFHPLPGGTRVIWNDPRTAQIAEHSATCVLSGERAAIPLLPLAIARCDEPDFGVWVANVQSVLDEVAAGKLQKAVLARVSTVDLMQDAGPFLLLRELERNNPHCHTFALCPSPESGTFIGASPELLYRRIGRRIETEAIAGTRSRSLDAKEDARLEEQLLHSAKERAEQGMVARFLCEKLREVCAGAIECTGTEVLKLQRLQHLRTRFAGTLHADCTDEYLLDLLHPTPATCGLPRDAAMDILARLEPFDRGWYAGAFGCISGDMAEFCVAIRSLHVRGGEAHVYAGAGIVEGSDAAREWAELESKAAPPLGLLGAA